MIKPGRDYFPDPETGICINPIGLDDRQAWDGALHNTGHSVFQTWAYCHALQKSLQQSIEMLSIRNATSGVIVIYIRRSRNNVAYDIYSPYGFGGILFWGRERELINRELQAWLTANNIITTYLMGHPVIGTPIAGEFIGSRTAYVLDLAVPEDHLWKQMSGSHTQELKKLFNDKTVSVTVDKEEIMSVFPRLYKLTLDRVGAGSAYFFSDETLRDFVQSEQTLLLGARINDTLHAVVLINFSNACAEYFINATDNEGRNLTRLLLWEGIKKLKALGVSTFNMGGGSAEGDQLEAFKKRFGGVRTAIPLYRKIIDTGQYQALCTAYGKDPEDLSYFPPYWKN